ncbi:MAG: hypothetical protein HPM95_05065 [Alphaproteobacteria bacterium]|nr:hypothetical protein [Alphaproteobacteria bacterium]
MRRWIAGYQTGSIACWELAWNLYAAKLGVARARPVITGLGCYARALNGYAKCGFACSPTIAGAAARMRLWPSVSWPHGNTATATRPAASSRNSWCRPACPPPSRRRRISPTLCAGSI